MSIYQREGLSQLSTRLMLHDLDTQWPQNRLQGKQPEDYSSKASGVSSLHPSQCRRFEQLGSECLVPDGRENVETKESVAAGPSRTAD